MQIEIRSPVVYCFGVFEFDPAKMELRRGGHYIHLQQQPLQLLYMLLQHAGNPVSREELRLTLWSAELVVDFDRNLNKAMNKLRHALGDRADSPRYIQTVHRVGYRFIAPMQRLGEVAAPLPEIVEVAPPRTEDASLIADEGPRVDQWQSAAMFLQDAALRRWVSALIAVVVIGLALRSWAPWPLRHSIRVVTTSSAVRLTSNEQNSVAMTFPCSPYAARLYSEAVDSLRRMDARAALQLLSQSIAIEPNCALSHIAMAKVWEQLGYDKRALKEAKTALALDDGSQRAQHLRVEGQYAVLSKNWKRAIEVYHALVKFFPDSVDDGLELAGAEVRAGDSEAALATVKTLKLLPTPLGNDPRLDLAESGAAESQGDYRRDLAAAKRGADKSKELGASLLLAQALADESWAFSNLGQGQQARATAESSLALFTQADDPRGVALDTGMIGIALLNQGDAAGAKQRFEQALHIHQALGGGLSVAGGYDNVGDAQIALGDLAGARASYERSLHAYQQIGHKDGVALVKESLGTLWLAAGDVPQGLRYLDEGLAAARQIGDRAKANDILSDMGDASRLCGDLDTSQRRQDEALAVFERLGDKSGAAKAHLALARLSMDRGAGQRAAYEAVLASTEYDVEHDFSNEASADAVLARALLTKGEAAQASKALVQAQRAAQHSDRVDTQLAVLLTAWLVNSHGQRSEQTAVERGEFAHIVLAAKKHGFVTFVSEANRQATKILRPEASS